MTLLEELFETPMKWKEMTPEQRRQWDRLRYARNKEKINARRRELYRLKKEQKARENN